MTPDLFEADAPALTLAQGAVVLRGFALTEVSNLLSGVASIAESAPFRQMTTPGGFRMSVTMTNCGRLGWVSDETGYRYAACDPLSGAPWPALPDAFMRLARDSAAAACFTNFVPDACLINRYEPGSRLSLHQDRNELDFSQPIVSVSLGLPAKFLFGGLRRTDPVHRIELRHGDVVVWGGPSRLRYHGIAPLTAGTHAASGNCRINLTFRKAG